MKTLDLNPRMLKQMSLVNRPVNNTKRVAVPSIKDALKDQFDFRAMSYANRSEQEGKQISTYN